jgi:hypothetical protein
MWAHRAEIEVQLNWHVPAKCGHMGEFHSIGSISNRILTIRGQRVMLDADLADLYGVTTGRLNEQVKRNRNRFPTSFMFQITANEWAQTLSQNATTSQVSRRHDRPPSAFTEHGCLMLSNVLKSTRAVEVSILIVEAFVELRTAMRGDQGLARRVDVLARVIHRRLGRQDRKLALHEKAILKCLDDIRRLTNFPEPVRRSIGFLADHGK